MSLNEYSISPEWKTLIPSTVVSLDEESVPTCPDDEESVPTCPDDEESVPTRIPAFVSLQEIIDGSATETLLQLNGGDPVTTLFYPSGAFRRVLQRIADVIVLHRASTMLVTFPDDGEQYAFTPEPSCPNADKQTNPNSGD